MFCINKVIATTLLINVKNNNQMCLWNCNYIKFSLLLMF